MIGRGHAKLEELHALVLWKAPRSAGRVKLNSEEYVAEITGFCLHTDCERARIEALTVLDGVGWPTASVILHMWHPDSYPILDYRALWSVCLEKPDKCEFAFWWRYVEFCRNAVSGVGVDMRTLDRSLWQYSKENQ